MFWGVTLPPYRILTVDAVLHVPSGFQKQPNRAMHGYGLFRGGGLVLPTAQTGS